MSAMRRVTTGLVVLIVAVFATTSASGAKDGLALYITFSVRSRLPLHYTLGCEPAAFGTLANAAAACTAIAADPKMVRGEPPPPFEVASTPCPPPFETLEIKGTFRGMPVDTRTDDSCSTYHLLTLWKPFLPTPAYLGELRVDQGLEALQLGQTHAAVSALLGAPTAHAGGAAIYKDGTAITFHVPVPFAVAVAYDTHGRIATLISDGLPQVDGRWDLTPKPTPPSPLTHWHHVICAGRHSLADHPLANHASTTIVWPAVDHATAIVTSEPVAACRLAKATEQAPLPAGAIVH